MKWIQDISNEIERCESRIRIERESVPASKERKEKSNEIILEIEYRVELQNALNLKMIKMYKKKC